MIWIRPCKKPSRVELMTATDKLAILKEQLGSLDQLIIAFSGGVDSTFLLTVAKEVLGERVLAVTVQSAAFPQREFHSAIDFAQSLSVRHQLVAADELAIPGFADNPPNRCYLCKKEIFTKISALASREGIRFIADGSNLDDLQDYRPGRLALSELGIISPLRDAGMSKDDIRQLSRMMALPTWDKPAFACLSSRFPYGETITRQKLAMVEAAEDYLLQLGFQQLRVRIHGQMARIEVAPAERHRFFDENLMDQIAAYFKSLGFAYTSLDLQGYRMGSLNESIDLNGSIK